MSVQELETVISQLPPADLAELAQWFEQFHADAWDKQMAQDIQMRLYAEAHQNSP